MRSCSLSRHLHQGRRYPLSSGFSINYPEKKGEGAPVLDLCSCGEACEVQGGEKGRGLNTYRCQGRKPTGEARDTLGLEILCAVDHKAHTQHNQHIAQISTNFQIHVRFI